jgi:hypothetical protein
MISRKTMETLESPSFRIDYIFGCRMRRQKEVRNDVLGRYGRTYKEVSLKRWGRSTPLLLKVKEVKLNGKRYIGPYQNQRIFYRA